MRIQRELFDERVLSKLEALLARVEGVRRGSDLPTYFDRDGEAAARAIAAAERQQEGSV